MSDKELESSVNSDNSDDHGNDAQQVNNGARGFVDSCNRIFDDLKELIDQGQWFNFFLYFGFLLTLLFAPGLGFLYPFIEKVLENNGFFNPNFYNFLFIGSIFFAFFSYLILKLVGIIKHSRRRARLFLSAFVLFLILIVCNLSLIRIDSIPGEINDGLSSGEESLFDKNSSESIIYKSNRKALRIAANPFNRPFKIATSLPINWVKGTFTAEEVLRGIAIAQLEWNNDKKHKNSQMIVLVADDGYDNPDEEEETVARKVAEKLTVQKDILGVVGHFSSATTQATADIYQEKKVVLISPTSTAIRCNNSANESNESSDCLKLNKYVFRTALSEETVIKNLLRYINQTAKDSKIAIIYEEDDPYSRLYKSIFMKQAEKSRDKNRIEVVNPSTAIDKCDVSALGQLNLSRCFSFIQAEKVNTLLLIPSQKNNVWVEKVIEFNRAKNYTILGSDTMYQENFINLNGKTREETEGMLISLSWHRRIDSKSSCNNDSIELECRAAKVFIGQRANEFRPLGINWRTATGYDAAEALFYAIETARNSCWIQQHFGIRADCIKNSLQQNLSDDKGIEVSNKGIIKFTNGDRDGINGVIVKASGGSFSKAPDSKG
ncbi:ABC transporter substrate-binding protein [Microcoleus sp. MON2_D5]|uniref:ABC transporter substrate-binding protein n=1 Tax=Microcoleus sp. MON2_D5 TaxID=2818833 RepID=UPI002FD50218